MSEACHDSCCPPSAGEPASGEKPFKLDIDSLMPYLLDRGVIGAREVIAGDTVIYEGTSRNRNFKVIVGDGGLLVKQPQDHADEGLSKSVKLEGRLLSSLPLHVEWQKFVDYAPTVVQYDEASNILATRLIHPATSMSKLFLNGGQTSFHREGEESAARLMARFHAASGLALERGKLEWVGTDLPIGLKHVRTIEWRAQSEPVAQAFLDATKGSTIDPKTSPFANQEAMWNEHLTGVVHGDPRWENFLLREGKRSNGDLHLTLVDWELISKGDPAYDVAGFLTEHLRFLLLFAAHKDIARVEDFEGAVPFAPEAMKGPCREFWTAYCKARRFRGATLEKFRSRVKQYVAPYASLIAWETSLAGGTATALSATAHKAVEFAIMIAEDPDKYTGEWFGLD